MPNMRGRTPDVGVARDAIVCVRYSGPEKDDIDEFRGGMSRSEFTRQAVAAHVKAIRQAQA